MVNMPPLRLHSQAAKPGPAATPVQFASRGLVDDLPLRWQDPRRFTASQGDWCVSALKNAANPFPIAINARPSPPRTADIACGAFQNKNTKSATINQKSGRPAIFIDRSPPRRPLPNSVGPVWKLVHSRLHGPLSGLQSPWRQKAGYRADRCGTGTCRCHCKPRNVGIGGQAAISPLAANSWLIAKFS
jgi:hypothetical protein